MLGGGRVGMPLLDYMANELEGGVCIIKNIELDA